MRRDGNVPIAKGATRDRIAEMITGFSRAARQIVLEQREAVDLAPAPEQILGYARASLEGLSAAEIRKLTRKLEDLDEE